MAYCLKHDCRLGDEVRRSYAQQLLAAATALTGDAASADTYDIHSCRKHVKKARALLDVIARVVPNHEAGHELKIANRALGELSDAHRVVTVCADLRDFGGAMPPAGLLDRLREALNRRVARFEQRAAAHGDRVRVARLLESARLRSACWDLCPVDPSIMVAAMADARRRSRHARRAAARHPSVDTFHHWRRLVKADWYLHRLVADHTGNHLIDDQHRLAALDACLGRLHDINVLAAIVAGEPLLARHDSATLLVFLRRTARDLRRQSRTLSVVLDERPGALKRRAAALWGTPAVDQSAGSASWRPAA